MEAPLIPLNEEDDRPEGIILSPLNPSINDMQRQQRTVVVNQPCQPIAAASCQTKQEPTGNPQPWPIHSTNYQPQYLASNQQLQPIETSPSQPLQVTTSNQQPQQIATSTSQPLQVTTSNQQPQQIATSTFQPLQVTTSNQQPQQIATSTFQPLQSTTSNQQPLQLLQANYHRGRVAPNQQPQQIETSTFRPLQSTTSNQQPLQLLQANYHRGRVAPNQQPQQIVTANLQARQVTGSDQSHPIIVDNGKPKDALLPAILITLFCCGPFGLFAIYNACRAKAAYRRGDVNEGKQNYKTAWDWIKASLYVVAFIVVSFVVVQVTMITVLSVILPR